MRSADLIRWGELTALVSAAVSVIGDILRLFVDVESAGSATGTSYALVFGLYLIGSVLLLLRLVGLYASQSEAAGVLGLVLNLGLFAAVVPALYAAAVTGGGAIFSPGVAQRLIEFFSTPNRPRRRGLSPSSSGGRRKY